MIATRIVRQVLCRCEKNRINRDKSRLRIFFVENFASFFFLALNHLILTVVYINCIEVYIYWQINNAHIWYLLTILYNHNNNNSTIRHIYCLYECLALGYMYSYIMLVPVLVAIATHFHIHKYWHSICSMFNAENVMVICVHHACNIDWVDCIIGVYRIHILVHICLINTYCIFNSFESDDLCNIKR